MNIEIVEVNGHVFNRASTLKADIKKAVEVTTEAIEKNGGSVVDIDVFPDMATLAGGGKALVIFKYTGGKEDKKKAK